MRVFVLVALTLLAGACVMAELPCSPIKVRSCPGKPSKAQLVHVYIDGCTEEPCDFKRDTNVEMEMDIEFNEPVDTLEARLIAIVAGTPIPWNGVNPVACQDFVSVAECPFEAGNYATYAVSLFVNPQFPLVSADVEYYLIDGKGETQVCWRVKANVVP